MGDITRTLKRLKKFLLLKKMVNDGSTLEMLVNGTKMELLVSLVVSRISSNWMVENMLLLNDWKLSMLNLHYSATFLFMENLTNLTLLLLLSQTLVLLELGLPKTVSSILKPQNQMYLKKSVTTKISKKLSNKVSMPLLVKQNSIDMNMYQKSQMSDAIMATSAIQE